MPRSGLAALMSIALCASIAMGDGRFPGSSKEGRSEDGPIPSFRHEIVPLLTRLGCNAGACHGKLSGQNGFRLSLRGYDLQLDHATLTREGRGRRINYAAPGRSLLMRKALALVPHGGGQRLTSGSKAESVLRAWISAGGPGPLADEPPLSRIQVTPQREVTRIGAGHQIQVTAVYADGRQRDITWLAKFESGDASQIEVSPEGQARLLRPGEGVVRVSYEDQIEIARLVAPFDGAAPADRYAARSNFIDEHVMNKLAELQIEPSQLCDDATFIRRAFLDTLGKLPTPGEVTAFLHDSDPGKRAALVDALLERPERVDYWTLKLADLLQNRVERDHDVRASKGVRSMHAWLREQVAANRPWDELAREVLLARGNSSESPEIGYYIVTVGEKSPEQSEVADSVAQAFLGTRIGCARCHNHPLEKYTQDDYYHFVAFFSHVALDRQKPEAGPTELRLGTKRLVQLQQRLAKQQEQRAAIAAGSAEDELEKIDKQIDRTRQEIEQEKTSPVAVRQPRTGTLLAPQPLDRTAVDLAGLNDPRRALVDWITSPENRFFSGAMVNRLWKHFLHVGLVEPVDDLRATNPPSNQQLWDALNREFVESGFDLKHMMRVMLNSRTYQLASDTLPANRLDGRYYSHYYARRIPAEPLLDAICQVTEVPEKFAGYPLGMRAVQLPESEVDSYFLNTFGRSERVTACACERSGEVTLPQLLHSQCGDTIAGKIRSGDGRIARLLAGPAEDAEVIEALFLTALCRSPSPAELTAILAQCEQSEDREAFFQDLLWALLNTKEFAFNH